MKLTTEISKEQMLNIIGEKFETARDYLDTFPEHCTDESQLMRK